MRMEEKINIKRLGESGKICEVFGHRWRIKTITYTFGSIPREERFCCICNKTQYKKEPEWEDIDTN